MADVTWVSDTHALPVATLAEATEFRVVDDPAGTPASKKTSIAGIRARLIAIANAWTANQTISQAALILSGNISQAAWTTTGVKLIESASTLTDTSSSGTVADARTHVLGGNTIAASSATTFTDYYSAFVSQSVAGSNVTLTNRWALGLSGGLKSTGQSLTGSQAQSLIDLSATWNTSGTPTALKLNITDTSSNAASLFTDYQVGGVSKLSTHKTGYVISSNITSNDPLGNGCWLLKYGPANTGISVSTGGTTGLTFFHTNTAGASLFGNIFQALNLGLVNSVTTNSADVILTRDAADTLAQRRTTNAQTLRWYHTFTDLSNRQNGALKTAASYIEVAAETAGTGAANIDVRLTPVGTGIVSSAASVKAHSGTAIPAGGTAGAGLLASSTANFGIFFGSGAPSLSAAQGSLYLRSDGSGIANRLYVNTDGGTTWTTFASAA